MFLFFPIRHEAPWVFKDSHSPPNRMILSIVTIRPPETDVDTLYSICVSALPFVPWTDIYCGGSTWPCWYCREKIRPLCLRCSRPSGQTGVWPRWDRGWSVDLQIRIMEEEVCRTFCRSQRWQHELRHSLLGWPQCPHLKNRLNHSICLAMVTWKWNVANMPSTGSGAWHIVKAQ